MKILNFLIILFTILFLATSFLLCLDFFSYINFFARYGDTVHGQIGDFWGGIFGAYFGFASFIGILYTIKFQAETSKSAADENTLLHLMNALNENLKTLTIAKEPGNGGREFFKILFERKLKAAFNSKVKEQPSEDHLNIIEQVWQAIYDQYGMGLGLYFRQLYNIVKFIDESSLKEKQRYTRLVRSQLSKGEISMLCYNCITKYGNAKFKALVEKYGLLKDMTDDMFLNNGHKDHYQPSAFGAKAS